MPTKARASSPLPWTPAFAGVSGAIEFSAQQQDTWRKAWPVVLALALTPCWPAPALAQAPKVGDPPEASNMRLVGMSDLQARSAYQPTIHRQGERYIAYIGHHGGTPDVPKPVNKMTGQAEFNGTSILDVTDPANPKYLKHLPGLEGHYEEGGAQMVRVCDGRTLPKGDPAKTYMLRVFGGKAHEIWDVSDPGQPGAAHAAGERARHAQELVGMRHRHRLPRLRHRGLARAPHDAGLRPERSGEAGAHPRLRHSRAGAGLGRHACRPSCMAASPPARAATASISATAPTRAACCRSSIARSC